MGTYKGEAWGALMKGRKRARLSTGMPSEEVALSVNFEDSRSC
jgi:hypothetical protein